MAGSIRYLDLAVRHAGRSAAWHQVPGFERTGEYPRSR